MYWVGDSLFWGRFEIDKVYEYELKYTSSTTTKLFNFNIEAKNLVQKEFIKILFSSKPFSWKNSLFHEYRSYLFFGHFELCFLEPAENIDSWYVRDRSGTVQFQDKRGKEFLTPFIENYFMEILQNDLEK